MTYFSHLFLFLCVALVSFSCTPDEKSVEGLWLMSHVNVGDQEMTPVAKWTQINADGTYESGNGWLKSSEGTWRYSTSDQTFRPEETNGLVDPFGPFEVSFPSGEICDEMIWSRDEDGMTVKVTLKRIDELPKAPADEIQGLWVLAEVQENDEVVTKQYDPEDRQYIFIRWDRIYVERTAGGQRQTGYWHMNGHSPEVIFLSHDAETDPQSWRVQTEDAHTLQLTGISDSNRDRIMIFSRINSFPE